MQTLPENIAMCMQAALQMTPAQKQHARELHDYYWSRMRGIMAERQRLSMAMLVCLGQALKSVGCCCHWRSAAAEKVFGTD